ncbi:MAG: acylphosphatase [Chitinophagales bacterium]
MAAVHVIIKGRVQGVYFRASAREMALGLGLQGWVKNSPEGHVELIASGKQEGIDRFLNWCEHGPPGAMVTDVQVMVVGEVGFNSFTILR